jgi:hypothetical protein
MVRLFGGPFAGEELSIRGIEGEIALPYDDERLAVYTLVDGDAAQFLLGGEAGYEFTGMIPIPQE